MATINLPFAASATKRVPSTGELANGFGCGDADLQLFDWLAWWETGQIAAAISKSGLVVDDGDISRLAIAIRSQTMNFIGSVGGTANALTAALDPAPASYAALIGTPLRLLIASTNTAATTINLNGLGAKSITRRGGVALSANDLLAATIVEIVYDGTNFILGGAQDRLPTNMIFFATPGTTNWTVPAGITRVKVRCLGAGAAGCGSAATYTGGGGGAGGYAEGVYTVTPGQVIPATVGAGSTGGASSPSNGGSSSFGAFCSATGGLAGTLSSGAQGGGGGGVGSGGLVNTLGGSGTDGSAPAAGVNFAGNGGASALGGGGRAGSIGGVGGQAPGSGGGSAYNGSGIGGNGANGIIIVEY